MCGNARTISDCTLRQDFEWSSINRNQLRIFCTYKCELHTRNVYINTCCDIALLVSISTHAVRTVVVHNQRKVLRKIDGSTVPRKTWNPNDRNKQRGVKLSRAMSLSFPVTGVYISYERRNIAFTSLGP